MPPPAQRPEASVVVPTLDRTASLRRCLAALERQIGVDSLEVVVVDAGSRDAEAVADVVGEVEGARLVRSEGRSPATARNTGIRSAAGRYVLFTDDDCVPAPRWAQHLLERLRSGASVVAGASIDDAHASPLAAATHVVLDYVTDTSTLRQGRRFATTNNLGCRRDLAESVPFDERFPFASEDRDWCARVESLGHTLTVAPDAVVTHRHELSLATFLRKHVAYGEGAYRFRRKHGVGSLAERPGFYVGLLRKGFTRGLRTGAAVGLAQAATGAGFAAAALTDLSTRRGLAERRSRDEGEGAWPPRSW